MPDSIGGVTVKFLRSNGARKVLPGGAASVTVRHIPGSHTQVADFGGDEEETWAGDIRVASISAYNSLKAIRSGYISLVAASTIVQNGSSRTGYIKQLGPPVMDPVGAALQCRVELLFAT